MREALQEAPPAPDWLADEAKDEWVRVTAVLVARSALTEDNLATLESYCLAVGMMRRAQKSIAKDGDTITSPTGIIRRHPSFQTLFQSQTESRRLAAELGLTPASRNKSGGGGKGGGNGDLFGSPWSEMGIQ